MPRYAGPSPCSIYTHEISALFSGDRSFASLHSDAVKAPFMSANLRRKGTKSADFFSHICSPATRNACSGVAAVIGPACRRSRARPRRHRTPPANSARVSANEIDHNGNSLPRRTSGTGRDQRSTNSSGHALQIGKRLCLAAFRVVAHEAVLIASCALYRRYPSERIEQA